MPIDYSLEIHAFFKTRKWCEKCRKEGIKNNDWDKAFIETKYVLYKNFTWRELCPVCDFELMHERAKVL